MQLSQVMQGPRLKVKRANSHIDTLIRETAVMPEHLYVVTNGPTRSHALLRNYDCFALAYRPKEPIKEYYGSIMGDAVNNLRESLDYWMNAAIKCVGGTAKTHFPFMSERKDLETSRHYKTVQKAFPEAADFISKQVEPCRDRNLDLWAATSLCNDNKHNDFLPVSSLARMEAGEIRWGTSSIGSLTVDNDADRPAVLIRSAAPFSVEGNLKIATNISFPQGAVFENQPVIPTLANMSQVVSQTLDALEAFIRPFCK